MEARVLHGLNMDVRETAMDKALIDLRKVGQGVRTEKERFNQLRNGFEQRLKDMADIASDEALQELKRTLEVLPPELAKEQIKLIMEQQDGMEQIVAVIKAMSLDKRKKILAEFQGPDSQALSDILKEIREGTGKGELIREIEDQLSKESKPQS